MKRAKKNLMTQKVIQLSEEGLSQVSIASKLGLSRYQVARIIHRHEKENRYRPINESDPFFYLKDNPMEENVEASRHSPDRLPVAPVPHFPDRLPLSRPSKDHQERAVSPPDHDLDDLLRPDRMPVSRPSKDLQERAAASIVNPPDHDLDDLLRPDRMPVSRPSKDLQEPVENPYREREKEEEDKEFWKRFGCIFVLLLIIFGGAIFFAKHRDTINQKIQDMRDFFTSENSDISDGEDAVIYSTHR